MNTPKPTTEPTPSKPPAIVVYEDSGQWSCFVCHGPVMVIGTLGTLEHGRCRNCGLDHSREAEEDEE